MVSAVRKPALNACWSVDQPDTSVIMAISANQLQLLLFICFRQIEQTVQPTAFKRLSALT